MRNDYEYDVFISYSREDEEDARLIYNQMSEVNLRVFWAEKKLPVGMDFPSELEKATLNSQHFVLYYTAAAAKSEWVKREWELFYTQCYMKDPKHRMMFVLVADSCSDALIPPLLRNLQHTKSIHRLVTDVTKTILDSMAEELKQATAQQNVKISLLESQLEQERRKVEEAQAYYRHNRFWGPVTRNRDVHIFTCARDVPHASGSTRGYGGRTNIDMWDYRAVLDITEFFAANYPNTKVKIEDPMSKLHDKDLEQAVPLAYRFSHITSLLDNKDCIIIGSPDVSDFAELTLAAIHHISPYTEGRLKRKGFVLIKERKYTKSSFYWEKEGDEEEGVARIVSPDDYRYFKNKPATKDETEGKMYGILVVANNPFCKEGVRRKIIILSGFSGVATNAIAKLLTDEGCLNEFFKLDNEYTDIERDVEALVGVEYAVEGSFDNRDTRRIKDSVNAITFEELVEI
jgi:TIR domain